MPRRSLRSGCPPLCNTAKGRASERDLAEPVRFQDEDLARQLRISTHSLARELRKCSPRACLQRKEAEGTSRMEAMRCLKSHLARRYHRRLSLPIEPACNRPA
jgi:hypothetical protein